MANFCKDNCLNERCKQCLMAIEELVRDEDLIDYDDLTDKEMNFYVGFDATEWDLEDP